MIIIVSNKKFKILIQPKLFFLALLTFIVPILSYSQINPVIPADTTTPLPVAPKPAVSASKKLISAEFLFADVEYEEMAVISNVLKIKNNTTKEFIFTMKISFPSGWRTLNSSEKTYTLPPNDSLFIPTRLLTSNKSALGGTKYNINVFIATNEGRQLAVVSFLAGRPKKSNWQMHILPRPRIYFLNGENVASFQVKLSNEGDEEEQLILSASKIGKDFMVSDTSGKFLKRNFLEFTLPAFSDTLVPFKIQIQKPKRNFKRIDTYSYLPDSQEEEKRYGLFFKTSEVGIKLGKPQSKSNNVDFVKLANSIDFVKLNDATRVNQYGSAVIPVTMIANINNILGQQPIMNTIFYGNTMLDKKSRINYFLQTGFTYYKYNRRTMSGTNGIVSYYHEKGFVSVGSGVGLNFDNLRGITNGRGIAGGYQITPKQIVGAYFVRNGQTFFNYQSTSFGASYGLKINAIRLGLGYDRTNYVNGAFSNGLNANYFMPIGKHQSFGAIGQFAIVNFLGNNTNRSYLSIYYNANYLKGKGTTGLSYSYREGNSGFGSGLLINNENKSTNIGLTNSYRIKKGLQLSLIDNYNIYTIPGFAQKNILFNNVLTLALPPKSKISYNPGAYLSYSNYFSEKLLSSGLQLSINTYNPEENFRLGFFLKGGYNKLLSSPELGTFFTAQTNTFLSYRTWNLNLRYFYGPQGVINIAYALNGQRVYPQTFSSSIGNQYQFNNKHFIWENTLNYTYVNVNNRHNMGLFSQLYYITTRGWRFNLNISYNYNISNSYKYSYSQGSVNNYNIEPTDEKLKNQNIQIGIGIKKDFAIPLPKKLRKTSFTNANFKAFLDINGNKKFDVDEIPLENIVLRLNDFEVLTNVKGEASFINIGLGTYRLQALPLVDVGAWFPIITDSIQIAGEGVIYIPFSQGVQILGNVYLDREKFSKDIQQNIDVSRMKIFLVDSLGKVITSITDNRGNFKFYVPYGNYILKFDEKILGTGFELTQNDIPVKLSEGMESFYHTFFIIEKKRRVINKKFGPDGKVIEPE